MSEALLIAIGAAFATWLMVTSFTGRGARTRGRRQRLLARVRGEVIEVQTAPSRRGPRLGLRPRRRLALRRPRRGFIARLETPLTRAGSELQPTEFVGVVAAVASITTLTGFLLWGSLGLLGGVALGLALPWFWIKRRVGARRKRINAQLNDLLQVVAGGLTAGQSFLQALASATREVGDPLGVELQVLLNEVELGATVEAALGRLRERVSDEDMDLVIDAVLIQRRVGGNLSEVLTNISWTIRERIRIRGEVKALTGQARMSGWLLGGLPLFLGVVMYLLNPEYMGLLIETPLGRMLTAAGLTGQLIGFLIMRKIADVKV